jgi:hypothetical protein
MNIIPTGLIKFQVFWANPVISAEYENVIYSMLVIELAVIGLETPNTETSLPINT